MYLYFATEWLSIHLSYNIGTTVILFAFWIPTTEKMRRYVAEKRDILTTNLVKGALCISFENVLTVGNDHIEQLFWDA